jgi:rhamnose utilization protein RhaD (predicted bifunctional aldolase and dehydrogenase)/NAD(P)-dependent dehydrogenase (short-subunit alcohol dehydrogenase family)
VLPSLPAMQSRYDAEAAAKLVSDLRHGPPASTAPTSPAAAPAISEPLALRTYTARLLGSNPSLVLHGGGNTSVKDTARTILGEPVDVIHVKGSGADLATIGLQGHPAVRLAPLLKLRALEAMTDEAMVNELRTNLLEASAPTPSVETLLHAFLPARFIDHTHADAILSLCDQPDGERIFQSIFGRGLVWIPYVMPGFALARRCIEVYERVAAGATPTVMVLEKHGLFTWGESARESYEKTIDAVTRAERYIAERGPTVARSGAEPRVSASDVLPRLRGAIAKLAGDPPERGPIVRLRSTASILSFLDRADVGDLIARGCATPDHVLRTKPTALLLPRPSYDDGAQLTAQLEAAVSEFARHYDAYFEAMCRLKSVEKKKLDPWPRIVLFPGLGACSIGHTAREADIALDVYEHTMAVMGDAADVGSYEPCSRADLFDVEYWSLEQAKIKPAAPAPLARCIALVTGAAGGIGLATAERLLAQGAHVALLDRPAQEPALTASVQKLGAKDRVLLLTADVRNEAALRDAFERVVATWGGLDVVVSNAGNAPEGRLETPGGQGALRESLELNLLSHATVARLAVDVMRAQGRGGCLLFNASKSAFNQGPGFGPYAVAKTALVSLMRQYAVDLAAQGIRSNAVNADRIRTGLFGGGVLESRAKARGVTVDDYFRANLLSREVNASDVGDAFAYLAGARATTGCVITVDGGNAAAFPR